MRAVDGAGSRTAFNREHEGQARIDASNWMLTAAAPAEGHVLELACGTGRIGDTKGTCSGSAVPSGSRSSGSLGESGSGGNELDQWTC